MHIEQNISLLPYNTFGIDMPAEYFLKIDDEGSLPGISADINLPIEKHIIGGGSNILLTQPVKGLTILNRSKGIHLEREDDDYVWVRVQSGEVWHEFVLYAITRNWAGIENLALIPGTVGAAPMQNIGAYGAEVKDVIEQVTVWDWNEQLYINYSNMECLFGYRDSIFKQKLKGQVFISSVLFRLNKKPSFNTSYGAIEQELQRMNISSLSIRAIADAVIAIRSSKLPNPKEIGNAGSFFKNPTISTELYKTLQAEFPRIPSYPVDATNVKVPAGWLIEQCGWKGYRNGSTGVHAQQALVLVNYGDAKGSNIWQLSEEILQSVNSKFGILLEREVQIW